MSEPYNGVHDQGNWEPEVPMKFHIAYNRHHTNKVKPNDPKYWRFNCQFKNGYANLKQISNIVKKGYCITAPHKHVHHIKANGKKTSFRVKKNVIECQIAGFDFDTKDYRSTFDHILTYPLFNNYALLYTTASHTAEKPKARAFIPLSEPIPPEDMELLVKSFLDEDYGDLYGWADKSCKECNQLFFGSKDAEVRFPPNPYLSVEVVYDCYILPYKQELERKEIERQAELQKFLDRVGEDFSVGNANGISKYFASVVNNSINTLANLKSGTGSRHTELLRVSYLIAGWEKCPQIPNSARHVFNHWRSRVLDACEANGYIKDYSRESALRAIQRGVDDSDPKMLMKQFIDVGDSVEVNGKNVIGVVQGSKCWDNVWYYKVNGVYYPVDWVRLR